METVMAIIGWISVFMIIYACGNICDLVALKLKIYQSSWLFFVAGLVVGFFVVAETDFPGYQDMSWIEEHVVAMKTIFSTWWLALLAVFGWGSAIWRIPSCLCRDSKTNQQENK